MEREGVAATESRRFATQFVAMAFGEWHRRLLFGGPPLTYEEMTAHAQFVTHLFLNGIRIQTPSSSPRA